jgi:hypothetical protein
MIPNGTCATLARGSGWCSAQAANVRDIRNPCSEMENRGTFARLLSHMLSFLPVTHGKASGRCRARRGSRRQTRKEVSNRRRQQRAYCITEVRLANSEPNATLD